MKMFRENQILTNHPTLALDLRFDEDHAECGTFFTNWAKNAAESELNLKVLNWSGKRGSNSRPQPWQGCSHYGSNKLN